MTQNIRQRPEGALLRTYLSAAGISAESMAKPLIGVVTAATQIFSEKPEAKELGGAVVSGIEAAGGIAVRWDTSRSPDMLSWGHAEGYSFAWRDQLADFIESWARQETLDGLVLVGDAPEGLVGMAMAAARLNLPSIVVPVTSTKWEYNRTTEESAVVKKKETNDPFALIAETLFGKKKGTPEVSIEAFTKCLLAFDNHATNAMNFVFEALGICLPGISTAASKSVRLHELAYASGEKTVGLVKSSQLIRRVLTPNAFSNAIRLNAALGGSVDVAVHLMALAHEAGQSISIDIFDKIARETPQLSYLGGVGEKEPHTLEDLDRAGGVWSILHVLKNHILPTPTVFGKGASEMARSTPVKETKVILGTRPYQKQSGIGMLKGNFAPRGAMFLLNQAGDDFPQFRGPAVVFDSEFEAAHAINNGEVKKGSVLVIRGQGPKGGPGLKKLRILPALLESRGLNKVLPIITDGRLPDTPAGLFISFVSPEAASKGPLSVVRNGDQVEIDLTNRLLNVRLTEMELQIRYARWQAPQIQQAKGFLARYSRLVSEAHEGAVLK